MRIDPVKSRLLTPLVQKHIHSPLLMTPSFLCRAADTDTSAAGGGPEGRAVSGLLSNGQTERRVSLSDVGCTGDELLATSDVLLQTEPNSLKVLHIEFTVMVSVYIMTLQ